MIIHNVLRTFGRHERAQDDDEALNLHWFTSERTTWLVRIPRLQSLLLNLGPDRQGTNWGEWYPFFGILSFALHEVALQPNLRGVAQVELVVHLNELLNP